MSVTPMAIADFTRDAFTRTNGSVSRAEITAVAVVTHRAPPEVLCILNQLPDRRFVLLNEIWDHLKGMPID